ncbi:hypothetical protein KC19_3G111800 [Ceratodon purpureus]|uniref:Uncharacterized protein n=1 Tax=Ceratodon purpureus TaxID=3225 RepID=A0A8T0IHA7_CERPU|nr:hypothetical protein KC19_3G111800 [Ceratodon purpureus]
MAYIEMIRSVALEMGPYIFTAWTTACSTPKTDNAWAWMKYLLFVPCPQHVLISSIHLIFVVFLAIYGVTQLATVRRVRSSAAHHNVFSKLSPSGVHTSPIYSVQVGCIRLVMLFQWCVAILRVVYAARYGWRRVPAQELLYSLSQALAWSVFAAIVGHQKKFYALANSKPLRIWWIMTFFLSLITLYTSVARYMRNDPCDVHLWIDGIVSIATFPVVVLLALVALVGRTGISVDEDSDLTESLLGLDGVEGAIPEDDVGVTDFASASIISKAMWLWLNPLLKRGKSKALEAEDIPLLSPEDRSEVLYSRFVVNFESQSAPASVRRALLHTFWPQLVFTAFLSVSKLSVMFVGPILITQFVSYVDGNELFPHEGLVLVAILFTAKTVEVLSAHHFSFYSHRLGMMVRSSLTTTVYRKGLRLSSFARQTHGAGEIVNYMSVDVQQIADFMLHIHNLWVLPLQAAVALVILYAVIGIPCFGGIFVMLCILFVSLNVAKLHPGYQAMIMKFKVKRMAITTKVFNNIKFIKLQAWEDTFKEKIENIRNSERTWLTKFMYVLAMNVFFLWLSPLAVSTATFALCVLLNVALTPAKVFTAISTFRIMQEPLRLFPQALMAFSQAVDSFDRLDKYMLSGELDPDAVERLPFGGEYVVEIEDGSFKWDLKSDRPTLKDVNVKVPHGAFVAIVGMAGSGKSALLSAVLGEIPKLSGSVKVRGRIAYVGQSAWIQNATIKDNILFGKEVDEAKYQETIRVCSLTQDLAQMTSGDQTEIGERGISLSGGQKQRIQLARAVYHDSDVYILDGLFSAIDAHTGNDLLKECIMGALGDKTLLVVTHQVEFLHRADLILVLRNGEIVQSGKYNDLLKAGTDFGALMAAHNEALDLVEVEGLNGLPFVVVDSCTPLIAKEPSQDAELSKYPSNVKTLNKTVLASSVRRSGKVLPVKSDSKAALKNGKTALIDDEKRATGQVSLGVYWLYATKAFEGFHVLVLLILQSCWQGLQIASDYYLAHSTADPTDFRPVQFITSYSELTFGSGFFVLLRSLLTAFAGLMTAQSFFDSFLSCFVRAPMAFFDTTPSGRILTRFASDQSNLDFLLPILMGTVLSQGFQALGILVVICQVTWQMIFLILPLAYAYFLFQRYYIATSRELTRMDAITKTPVILHFSETISGFVTIRAFGEQPRFATVNMERVNANLRMDFHSNAANEWLGFRLEMIGTVMLASSALVMVTVARNIIGSELVGLSLSYGLALNGCLCGVVYLACQLENKMVSVERINQYCGITSEAPPVIENSRPAESWPTHGSIQFQRLQLRLRPDTPLMLKGISLNIKGGEKVGVVGRTSSGKSTLIQALLRLVEPSGGRILIDNLDIQLIGVKDLRTKFGVISHEPTLFEGTVRTNIDPLQEHSDREIWEALQICQLAGTIKDKNGKLDSLVVDVGENWSVGQRQLFSMGRALLKKAKILIYDETTASVDTRTDAIIQKIIRSEFAKSTVISIAHRIPTVMDSDKVLVLDSGLVKEFDVPSRLLEQPGSLFASLVREYSERSDPDE